MRRWRPGARLREAVIARAGVRCEYCGVPATVAADSFEIEHVAPVSQGGGHDLENLALACGGCNSSKAANTSARDPLTCEMVLLYNPRRERWDDHFVWDPSALNVVGRTPSGRATITALRLNRPGLCNLRRLLAAVGEHPPLPRTS